MKKSARNIQKLDDAILLIFRNPDEVCPSFSHWYHLKVGYCCIALDFFIVKYENNVRYKYAGLKETLEIRGTN